MAIVPQGHYTKAIQRLLITPILDLTVPIFDGTVHVAVTCTKKISMITTRTFLHFLWELYFSGTVYCKMHWYQLIGRCLGVGGGRPFAIWRIKKVFTFLNPLQLELYFPPTGTSLFSIPHLKNLWTGLPKSLSDPFTKLVNCTCTKSLSWGILKHFFLVNFSFNGSKIWFLRCFLGGIPSPQ